MGRKGQTLNLAGPTPPHPRSRNQPQAWSTEQSLLVDMSDLLPNPKLCKNCGTPGCKFKCACKQGYYCSRKCQKKDWKKHKEECAMVHCGSVKEARREHGRDDVRVAEARLEAGLALLHQAPGAVQGCGKKLCWGSADIHRGAQRRRLRRWEGLLWTRPHVLSNGQVRGGHRVARRGLAIGAIPGAPLETPSASCETFEIKGESRFY